MVKTTPHQPERMKTYKLSTNTKELVCQINTLHQEISVLMQSSVEKAIECGELLVELKLRVGHGKWRNWIADNLHFSARTAARYMACYWHRDELGKVKSLREAAVKLAHKEHAIDALGADYRRIVGPLRAARRQLEKLNYMGESAEAIEIIRTKVREELAELSDVLERGKLPGFVQAQV